MKKTFLGLIILFLASVFLVFFWFWQSPNYQIKLNAKILQPLTTSSLLMPAAPITKPKITTASLFFAGDIMLDRSVWEKTKKANDYHYPFAKFVIPEKFDLRIANLEGPITDFKSVTQVSRMSFTFSPLLLPALKNNFDIVSLANNHTNNFGEKGLTQTREYLTTSSIQYFGDPNNVEDFIFTTTSVNDVSIGFLGYNQLSKYDFAKIKSEIRNLKSEINYLVVYPHWGTEYLVEHPNQQQISEAHELLAAGADLIIGSHPHVIEPIEEYQGKYIFYSLGNFIFDQYFSLETQQGLTAGVYLTKKEQGIEVKYKLFPVQISSGSQVSLATSTVRTQILESLAKLSKVNTSTKEGIINGEFK